MKDPGLVTLLRRLECVISASLAEMFLSWTEEKVVIKNKHYNLHSGTPLSTILSGGDTSGAIQSYMCSLLRWSSKVPCIIGLVYFPQNLDIVYFSNQNANSTRHKSLSKDVSQTLEPQNRVGTQTLSE